MYKAVMIASGAGAAQKHNGGELLFGATGALGGGTLTLEVSPDSEAWLLAEVAPTVGTAKRILLPPGWYRFVLTGATDPNVTVFVW